MVVFGVILLDDVFNVVDFFIFGFLFVIMVVSVYFERVKVFDYLVLVFLWKIWGGKDFMCRVCVLVVIFSVVFINDSICVVLIGFVFKFCDEKKFDFKLFFIVFVCSFNIGFVVIFIGNL